MFLAIFVLWKKYSRMLTVSSGHCFPILVMWIRIFLSGPIKPTGMVRTVICPSKMFSPFNCERKLVICYSAIYYSQTSGSRLEQFLYASIDSDIDICEASGSDLDTESSEQVESEHAVSLQFVVVSALVTLACPSELSGWKKVVTRVM